MDLRARMVEDLCRAVLTAPGDTTPDTRRAAFAGTGPDGPVGKYARSVHEGGHRVTDADIARLRAAGHTEDAIFEITLAAAVGAASIRLAAGLRALDQGRR